MLSFMNISSTIVYKSPNGDCKLKAVNPATAKLAFALGQRIKKRRLELKMSQKAMGKEAGITQVFVSRIETGKAEVCLGSLQAICKALDISIADLFAGL